MAEVVRKHPNYLPRVENINAHHHGAFDAEKDTLKKTVADMVTAASYYKNWERELKTPGVALVLGEKWPETS